MLGPDQAGALINGTIRVGMDRKQVVERLGTPPKTETYGATEFLFYSPPWYMAAGTIFSNPIAITDGKVAGFGKIYYANFAKTAAN